MKRRIISYCAVVLLLALLCACSSNPAEPNNSELEKNETPHSSTETVTNELYEKAMTILNELNDPRIDDFRAAYDLLMDMPEDKDDFVNQLDEVNRIFEKYNIDFKYGGWYLQPHLSDDSITQEGLDEYRTQNAYYCTFRWGMQDKILYLSLFLVHHTVDDYIVFPGLCLQKHLRPFKHPVKTTVHFFLYTLAAILIIEDIQASYILYELQHLICFWIIY